MHHDHHGNFHHGGIRHGGIHHGGIHHGGIHHGGIHHGGIHHGGFHHGSGYHPYGGGLRLNFGGYGRYWQARQYGPAAARQSCACCGGVGMTIFGCFFTFTGFIMTMNAYTGLSASNDFFSRDNPLRILGPAFLVLGVVLLIFGIMLICVTKKKLEAHMNNATTQQYTVSNTDTSTAAASVAAPMPPAGPASMSGTTTYFPQQIQYPTGPANPPPPATVPGYAYNPQQGQYPMGPTPGEHPPATAPPAFTQPLMEKSGPPNYDDAKKM